MMKSLTESVFSCRLRQTLFLVKLYIFAMAVAEPVTESVFGKVQAFTIINSSDRVCF